MMNYFTLIDLLQSLDKLDFLKQVEFFTSKLDKRMMSFFVHVCTKNVRKGLPTSQTRVKYFSFSSQV